MKSAMFTGHRILSGDVLDLEQRLYSVLERGICNYGLRDFFAGGAVGWDTLAAKTVLLLRERYSFIKLHLILPCCNEEQTLKWSTQQRTEFYRILSLANSVEYTAYHYYNGCMAVRNARLVELATDCCFCYFDQTRHTGGTAQTVRLALQKSIMIVNFYRD